MKKILFLGFHHNVNDPRLVYREMALIKSKCNDLKIFMIQKKKEKIKTIKIRTKKIFFFNNEFTNIEVIFPKKKNLIFWRIIQKLQLIRKINKIIKEIQPDIIQASHAGELLISFISGRRVNANLIYDSHEDYFNQILEYQGKTLKAYIKAIYIFLYELILIRFHDKVFCTDEYLLQKYCKPFYGAKEVSLMRNFPYVFNKRGINKGFYEKKRLKLVYIGSVNKFRGVLECANYVKKFNKRFKDKNLTLDVFAAKSEIIEKLKREKLINYHPYINYLDLLKMMELYDLGVCLWLPIKKYFRNLPLKNFDYMGVGLPIITSNFGNLKIYIERSKSGICIDPKSYIQFERAVLEMFDTKKRKRFSDNGKAFVKESASFQKEGEEYLNYIGKILK